MTSVVTKSTLDFLAAKSVGALTGGVGLVVLGLLAFLLIEREILAQATRRQARLEGFTVMLIPLVFAFGVAVVVRFAALSQ